MNEIRVARKALLAYFTISALVMSVTMQGASMPACIACTTSTDCASPGLAPITIRSGCCQSRIACPSRKNSGLETYRSSNPLSSRSATRCPVPGGTVLFITAVVPAHGRFLIHISADLTWFRSAAPSSPGGVPVATSATSPNGPANPSRCTNRSRPWPREACSNSSSPGSKKGTLPAWRIPIRSESMSTPVTSWPASERQAAATVPT